MFHALEIPAFSNAVNGSKDVPVFVLGLIDLNHLHVALPPRLLSLSSQGIQPAQRPGCPGQQASVSVPFMCFFFRDKQDFMNTCI